MRVAVTIEDVQAARIPPIELGALDGDVSRGVEIDGRVYVTTAGDGADANRLFEVVADSLAPLGEAHSGASSTSRTSRPTTCGRAGTTFAFAFAIEPKQKCDGASVQLTKDDATRTLRDRFDRRDGEQSLLDAGGGHR